MIAFLLWAVPIAFLVLVLLMCHVLPDRAGDLARIRAARARSEGSRS
jgi:cytochrome c-type biogenesis protein CcmH/NrfF